MQVPHVFYPMILPVFAAAAALGGSGCALVQLSCCCWEAELLGGVWGCPQVLRLSLCPCRRGSPLLIGVRSEHKLSTDHIPILYRTGERGAAPQGHTQLCALKYSSQLQIGNETRVRDLLLKASF